MNKRGRFQLRILMTAFACDIHLGSEPGAGFRFAKAAREIGHDIHLITRTGINADTEGALRDLGIRLTKCGPALGSNHHLSYLMWVMNCRYQWGRRVSKEQYDLVHHVTYASDSMPPPIPAEPGKLVWGPIGGTQAPHGAGRFTERRVILERVRWFVKRVVQRTMCARPARKSSVVIAQNFEAASQFRKWSENVIVRPNAVIDDATLSSPVDRQPMHAIMVGRLIPSKGADLALRAIAKTADWQLTLVGGGPERQALEELARELAISTRVHFTGQIPKAAVFEQLAGAHCMLFPSIREAAGWAVAEARAVSTPVIALNVAGPQYFATVDDGVRVVAPHGDIPARLADELKKLGEVPRDVPSPMSFDEEGLRTFLREVYGSCA